MAQVPCQKPDLRRTVLGGETCATQCLGEDLRRTVPGHLRHNTDLCREYRPV